MCPVYREPASAAAQRRAPRAVPREVCILRTIIHGGAAVIAGLLSPSPGRRYLDVSPRGAGENFVPAVSGARRGEARRRLGRAQDAAARGACGALVRVAAPRCAPGRRRL